MCGARLLAQSDQAAAYDEETTAMQLSLRSHFAAGTVGVLGLDVAAGVFGAAAIMSAAAAPTARADDFTDIINAVDGDFTAGQADFSSAITYFGSGDPSDGLAQLLNGVNDDLISPGDNLFIGTVDALTNQPVEASLAFGLGPVGNFADAVNELPSLSNYADLYFSDAATAFAASDFATAAYDSSIGALYTFDLPWETLLQGAADSLGF
jgi:hypothetical protein